MSFFDGQFEWNAFVTESLEYPLSPDVRHELETDAELVLGIRPEDVRVGERSTDERRFEEEVVVEPMGNESIVRLRFDEEPDGRPTIDRRRYRGTGSRETA